MPRRPAYCGPSWCHDSRVNTTHTSATQTCEHFDFHNDDADEDFEGFSQERISERIGDQGVDVPSASKFGRALRGEYTGTHHRANRRPDSRCASASNCAGNHPGPCSSSGDRVRGARSCWRRAFPLEASPCKTRVFFLGGKEGTKWMTKCAGIRSADESGSKLHTTTATPAQRGESRVGPHVTEELLHQLHGRLGAPASSLPLLWPPCRPTVNPIGGAMPALPVCAAVCFRHERVLQRVRTGSCAPPLTTLPPTSTARTTSLARARRPRSSG